MLAGIVVMQSGGLRTGHPQTKFGVPAERLLQRSTLQGRNMDATFAKPFRQSLNVALIADVRRSRKDDFLVRKTKMLRRAAFQQRECLEKLQSGMGKESLLDLSPLK